MIEFVELIASKRRYFIAGLVIIIDLFLMTLLASAAHSHHVSAEASGATINTTPAHSYDNPNIVTDEFLVLNDNIGQFFSSINQEVYSSVDSVAVTASNADKMAVHGTSVAVTSTLHGIGAGSSFVGHSIGSGVSAVGDSFDAAGHAVGVSSAFVGHDVVVGSISLVGRSVVGVASYEAHGTANALGVFPAVTHISSIIRPVDKTPAPTITELRLQQAALIQKGTKDVLIAALTHSSGGACDSGDGNGGYPKAWCNAPMDSLSTVSYSGDPINRECTSYAYWYFTSIEGHANLHVWGNAKDWAATSNYPTHALAAVGAIAVETAGAYGHVAIVQALPGQKFAGKVVPAGYILVSEMNYDWNGHFRYSYSPLGKFSAFIY